MREIKFRAWVNIGNTPYMAQVTDIEYNNGKIVSIGCLGDHTQWFEGQFILMQFTGLKDKNGVEIYEGDYLKVKDCYQDIFIVEYHPLSFCLFDGKDGCMSDFDWEDWERSEVIGNSFENPELLK